MAWLTVGCYYYLIGERFVKNNLDTLFHFYTLCEIICYVEGDDLIALVPAATFEKFRPRKIVAARAKLIHSHVSLNHN